MRYVIHSEYLYDLTNAIVAQAVNDLEESTKIILAYGEPKTKAESELYESIKSSVSLSARYFVKRFKNKNYETIYAKQLDERYMNAVWLQDACLRFFQSGWLVELTDIEGKYFADLVDKRVKNWREKN